MSAVKDEIRMDSSYTTKDGVTVIIRNVSTKFLRDEFGIEHQSYSFAVAMRLEELTNYALELDSTAGVVHHLEF